MKNAEIAKLFHEMADVMEILGEDVFRVNSYRKAGRTLEEYGEPIEDVAKAGGLMEIPGIGKSTAEKIEQYLKTGKIARHEELLAQVPPTLGQLLAVPGLGPKTVAKLWKELGVTSAAQLEEMVQKDPARVAAVPGLGPKKVQQIVESLAFVKTSGGRMRLGEADKLAGVLIEAMRKVAGVGQLVAAGSLRRGKETVGDLDLLCEGSKDDAGRIIREFTKLPMARRVLAGGETKGSVLLEGDAQVDLRVVEAESFGAALAYFTGSKEHNVHLRELAVKKGWKLNEYGLFEGDRRIAGRNEQEIYQAMGLPYIPPELRENHGEIEAGAKDRLPSLMELGDIRGDLHMHTKASDGLNTIEEMIEACRDRGYKYLCISDHSKSEVQAHGLDEARLADHASAIRKAAKKYPGLLVLVGAEVDIFKDGRLDFEADVLKDLDFVIASAHSALSMPREEATRRLIEAIETPHVHCIGHPSGRLINSRPGMELDIAAIAHAAAKNHVALEINAHPMRLDLRDVHVRAAIEAGCKLIINTDAHSIGDLDLMRYGVTTARRGWATADDVINTFSAAKFKKWIGERG